MKKMFSLILSVILGISLVGCDSAQHSEPETCSLCGQFPRHAPCVINLTSGDMVELELYTPHPTLVAEIAEQQMGGEFYLIHRDWIKGSVDMARCAVVTLQKNTNKMDGALFCASCRDLLSPYKRHGYVIADLRIPKDPVLFAVRPSDTFGFRCYDIDITKLKEDKKYEIRVTGTFDN